MGSKQFLNSNFSNFSNLLLVVSKFLANNLLDTPVLYRIYIARIFEHCVVE